MKIPNVSSRHKEYGFFKRYLRKKFIRDFLRDCEIVKNEREHHFLPNLFMHVLRK